MHIKCMLWFESPGYYFPMCENSRHSRGLGGRAVSSGLSKGLPLPPAYHRLFWAWFAFGFPAFAAVLGILWLMITRPAFRLFL